jgi:hypothetical protein
MDRRPEQDRVIQAVCDVKVVDEDQKNGDATEKVDARVSDSGLFYRVGFSLTQA